jgi:hypothetical protein
MNYLRFNCSGDLIFNRTEYEMDSYFDYIMQNSNISILTYAGDIDLVCNFMMQELFVNDVAIKNNLTVIFDSQHPVSIKNFVCMHHKAFPGRWGVLSFKVQFIAGFLLLPFLPCNRQRSNEKTNDRHSLPCQEN